MTKITEEHIDCLYDAVTMMCFFSQRLSEGDVDDKSAGEMSWLLGSAKKRLEPILDLVEKIQTDQDRAGQQTADQIGAEIDEMVFIGRGVHEVWRRYADRKAGLVDNGDSGEN